MRATKQKILNNQNGMAFVLVLIILIVFSALGFVGYKVYQNQRSSSLLETQNNFEFNQNFSLQLKQTATLGSNSEEIKFRFTELEPASNPDAQCEELCLAWIPTIMTELEYAGKIFKGTARAETGGLDMTFTENGAYPLVPYSIELAGVDFNEQVGTVKITQKKFTKVELDEQFTLESDSIAALVPGKTGVYIRFDICGNNLSCIQDINFYVDDEYVWVHPYGFADPKAPPELQFASKDGSYIEHDGIRLRLIETDDKTYATFVFEKV